MSNVNTERETLRCKHCELMQFKTKAEICRRCFKPYQDPVTAQPEPVKPAPKFDWGFCIRLVRQAKGMSQLDLSRALGLTSPRTWISKIERGQIECPTLESLERLAVALGTRPGVLVLIASAAGQTGVQQ